MIKLQNVFTPTENNIDPIPYVASALKTDAKNIKSVKLLRRSVDARKKPNIYYCNTFLVDFYKKDTEKQVLKSNKNAFHYKPTPYIWLNSTNKPAHPPIIIGSGPAGLFAALTLAKAGLKPIIIERGEPVEERVKSVDTFWQGKKLNPNSNVQFGEGGAGTFSDGKLNTGIKDVRCRTVLELFNIFGASDDILINAKPHIGTDVLRTVVKNIRNEIILLGGRYYFNTTFLKPVIKSQKIVAVKLENEDGQFELPCDYLITAIGNAARDTYQNLWDAGLNIIPKPFAIGVRIEHLQSDINNARYGKGYSSDLPPAEYKLATHLENGRGVYTFCMCPGGKVVNSASEDGTYVTNGMSYESRNEANANSALLVGVTEKDFEHLSNGTPFGGVNLQKQIEKAAFLATNGKGLPVQTVGDFLNSDNTKIGNVLPTALPNTVQCDLKAVLPSFITDSIKLALPTFEGQIKGFSDPSAVLTAPETRSSSPVRILRDENFVSNVKGIFPCGEGAGYAGGITSSAVDGIRTAEAVINLINQ